MTLVSMTIEDHVAVVLLDNPPVNMGNHAMRSALLSALDEISASDASAVVIASAGRHFYAGSDISEFDRPLEAPQLPQVIAAVEALPIPVVAAINGLALGGGFELALGCDGRVMEPDAKVGLPEVTLGFAPGAGGTVRTARLIGVPDAIRLVTSARQLTADQALAAGIADRVVPRERLLSEAIEFARSLGGKRILRDAPVPEASDEEIDAAVAEIHKRARPNVLRAAEMVRRAAQLPGPEALVAERALFDELRVAEEAVNLRYLFFGKRTAAKDLSSEARPVRISSVGVAGAGTMGAALVRAFARAGYATKVIDAKPELARRVADETDGADVASSFAEIAACDLVIDAVFEDMDVKRAFFTEIDAAASDATILASNTSYLDLAEMSSDLSHRNRFIGMHFFNPADRNPLVEVIPLEFTDPDVIATIASVAGRLGKSAIRAGNADGFVANRVYAEYRSQVELLVEDGAAPQDVDAALTGFGFAMGPFAVADMSGLDIAWSRRKRQASSRNPRERYSHIADRLCEAGRFGRKSGAGWYQYPDGATRGEVDPVTEQIIAEARAERVAAARQVGSEEVVARALAAMVFAAADLVESGVARRASDIDVAMTEGFAFPKHHGGPLRHVASWPAQRQSDAFAALYDSDPERYGIFRRDGEELPPHIRRVLDDSRSA